jgi:putative copper resistance protein D
MTAPGAPRRSTVVVAGALLIAEVGGGVALALGSALLLPDWFGAMGWGTDALAAQRSAALGAVLVAAAPTLLLLIRALRAAGSAPSSLARPDAVAA